MNQPVGMTRVLVVDDEPQITSVLQTSLAASGYDVQTADDGQSAIQIFRRWRPQLVITDLSMPRMGGIALCQTLRDFSSVPIIVVSVKDQESTKVQALEAGADDYLTKPFGMDELLARVKAALRRASTRRPETTVLQEGDFRIDLEARRTYIRGKEIRLTPKEFELLTLLLHNAGKVLTHKSLVDRNLGKDLRGTARRDSRSGPPTPQKDRTQPSFAQVSQDRAVGRLSFRARIVITFGQQPLIQLSGRAPDNTGLIQREQPDFSAPRPSATMVPCFRQWACSSVGRAPRSQRGGRGFESPHVHQIFNSLRTILR